MLGFYQSHIAFSWLHEIPYTFIFLSEHSPLAVYLLGSLSTDTLKNVSSHFCHSKNF